MPQVNGAATGVLSGIGLFKADVNVAVAQFKLDVAKVRRDNRNPLENEDRKAGYAKALESLTNTIKRAAETHFGNLGEEVEAESKAA